MEENIYKSKGKLEGGWYSESSCRKSVSIFDIRMNTGE